MKTLKVAGLIPESIVDGPGLRFVVFAQGCLRQCEGCHNPSTFDLNGGTVWNVDDIIAEIKKDPLLQGVTFSGGEPFLQADSFTILAKKCRELGLNVLSYTGFTFEQLLSGFEQHPEWQHLLETLDILIDGPFILDKKSMLLLFRGSSNQRIIDVPKSLKNAKAIIKQL